MAIELKLRTGSTADSDSFTGAEGEVTVEHPVDGSGNASTGDAATYPWHLRIHDGSLEGGHIVPTTLGTDTLSNKTLASPVITGSVVDSGANNVITLSNDGTASISKLKIPNANDVSTLALEVIRTRAIKMSLAIGGGEF